MMKQIHNEKKTFLLLLLYFSKKKKKKRYTNFSQFFEINKVEVLC